MSPRRAKRRLCRSLLRYRRSTEGEWWRDHVIMLSAHAGTLTHTVEQGVGIDGPNPEMALYMAMGLTAEDALTESSWYDCETTSRHYLRPEDKRAYCNERGLESGYPFSWLVSQNSDLAAVRDTHVYYWAEDRIAEGGEVEAAFRRRLPHLDELTAADVLQNGKAVGVDRAFRRARARALKEKWEGPDRLRPAWQTEMGDTLVEELTTVTGLADFGRDYRLCFGNSHLASYAQRIHMRKSRVFVMIRGEDVAVGEVRNGKVTQCLGPGNSPPPPWAPDTFGDLVRTLAE